MKWIVKRHGAPLLLLAVYACAPPRPVPLDTGARAAAQAYYDALLQQDWPKAYGVLHSRSRAHCNLAQFSRLAQSHRQGLGFEPSAARIRSCEEHGGEATVHALLTGRRGARARQYKDALVLRSDATGWGVLLPPRFGQSRP